MARFETRRDHILDAAWQVVSDGGFRDLQMLTVAASAGLSVGAIYRYFASKAELCAALVARVSAREVQVLAAIAATDAPAAERLADGVRTFVRRALQNRRLAYAMIAEPVDEAVDSERLAWRERISEVFAGIIEDGIADATLRDAPPRLTASCIVGAFMEALIGPLSPEVPADEGWEPYVEAITGFCITAVLGHSDTAGNVYSLQRSTRTHS